MGVAGLITRGFEALHLRGAPTVLRYLGRLQPDRLATVVLPSGESITFPAWDAYWCRYLYAGVPYEPDVETILRRFAPGRVLVDCGANIGYWSARAERLGFAGAVAVEANPEHIPLLERNFAGPVHHAAVHSRSGEQLYLGGHGVAGALAESGAPVRSLALRDLGLPQPAVVKLDVEGAEIAAIKGAKGVDAVFVYEDWPRSGMLVTEYLLGNGYGVFGFDQTEIATHRQAFDFNRRTTARYGPSNFYALRERA
jgi:FkbM family methyltransferase